MDLGRKAIDKIYNKLTKIAQKGKEGAPEYWAYIDELIQRGQYTYFCDCLYLYYYIDTTDYIDVAELKKKTYPDICFNTKSDFLTRLSKLYKQKKVYQSSIDIYSDDLSYSQVLQTGPLSNTYSLVSATPSVNFQIQNEQVGINLTSDNLYRVTISKAKWEEVNGVDTPQDIELFQQIEISQGLTFSYTQIPTTFASQYLVTSYERGPYLEYNYKVELVKSNNLGTIKEIDLTSLTPEYYVYAKKVARFYGDFNTYLEVTKVGATSSVIIDYFDPKLSDDSNLLKRYNLALDYLLS